MYQSSWFRKLEPIGNQTRHWMAQKAGNILDVLVTINLRL
jgi:hypothetical protein